MSGIHRCVIGAGEKEGFHKELNDCSLGLFVVRYESDEAKEG